MNYYVIQVETRGEEKYLQLAKDSLYSNAIPPEQYGKLLWPRRRLLIRKKGQEKSSLAPIFPGYVFLEADRIPPDVYWTLRRVPGFFKFLKTNQNIEPLQLKDRGLLIHFLTFGEIVDKSKVWFDVDKKIRVADGPMKGLEGKIISVDKRKKRAKIKLSLYSESFTIDFGFELIESAEGDNEKKKA